MFSVVTMQFYTFYYNSHICYFKCVKKNDNQLPQTGQYQAISATKSYSSGGMFVHSLWYQVLHRSLATQSKPLLVSQPGQIVSLTLSSGSDGDGGGDGGGDGDGLLVLFLY